MGHILQSLYLSTTVLCEWVEDERMCDTSKARLQSYNIGVFDETGIEQLFNWAGDCFPLAGGRSETSDFQQPRRYSQSKL